jgi:GntR family transcriptional regulator, transcriptional repressor for pyruvate dehydrogenase complex
MVDSVQGETDVSIVRERRAQAWLDSERSDKVAEIVARKILTEIVDRGLPPGTQLPSENAMLEIYGAGRSSVREALRILEVHGVIRIKPGPGGGAVVRQLTYRDFGRSATLFLQAFGTTMGELMETRVTIEPMLARIAAQRITPEKVAELEAVLAAEQAAAGASMAKWSRATAMLHSVVAGATGNRILDLLGCALIDIHADRYRPVHPVGGREPVMRVHRRIARAVINGEGDEAERLMRRHLEALGAKQREMLPGIMEGLLDWR